MAEKKRFKKVFLFVRGDSNLRAVRLPKGINAWYKCLVGNESVY